MRFFQFITRWSQLRGESAEAAALDERDRQLEDWLNELAASSGGGGGTGDMLRANNLSDVLSVATARSNLGLGTAAVKNAPAAGNAATTEVVMGNDTRLTDTRTPSAHASTHSAAGSDPISHNNLAGLTTGDPHTQYQLESEKAAANGYAGLDAATKVPIAQLPTGASSTTVCIGNDSRLSDARTPTAHAASHAAAGSDPLTVTTGMIAANAVDNTKLAQVASGIVLGRATAATGNVENLTGTQVTALLNAFTTTLKGLAPASGGGTTNFLRADGTWAAPAGGAAAVIGNGNTADVVANAADTYLAGSSLAIGGRLKAGTVLRWRLAFSKTAAGTAVPQVIVRFGTAGTTADAARLTWNAFTVQTAAVDTGYIEIEAVVRAVSATGTVGGHCNMQHKNTTTGISNVAQGQQFGLTSAAFDTTVANLIAGVSVNPGAAGVWTFRVVTGEAFNLN